MARLALLAALLSVRLASATAAHAQAVDAAALVARADAAIERNNAAWMAAAFTDDAVYEGGFCGRGQRCVGLAAIQRAVAAFGELRITPVGAPRVSGDTVTTRSEAPRASDRRAGVDRIILNREWQLRDGKIARVRAMTDATDPETARYLALLAGQAPASTPTQLPRTGEPGALAALLVAGSLVLGAGVALRRRAHA